MKDQHATYDTKSNINGTELVKVSEKHSQDSLVHYNFKRQKSEYSSMLNQEDTRMQIVQTSWQHHAQNIHKK